MILRIFSFIVIFLFILQCGFEPIYSKKNMENKSNFSVSSINFTDNSDKNINHIIKNHLKKYLNLEGESKIIDLKITITIDRIITSKNKKGNAEVFSMESILISEVSENGIIIGEKNFKENFEYKTQENKFNLEQYEKNIKKNLANQLTNNLIFYLYSLK